MLEMSSRELIFLGERMEEFRVYWARIEHDGLPPATDEEREALRRTIEKVQDLCERLDFPLSVRRAFDKARTHPPKTHDQLHDLFCLFKDEAKSHLSLVLSPNASKMLTTREPFGPDVFAKFNDAARDLDEATRCLALERNTAVVFHLMLAMERVLRRMALQMGADPFNKKGDYEKWSVLVGRMKEKIPSQPPDKQDEWTAAHNLLWGVGKVWRNDTMHPADAYTDAEAKEVYGAVRVFMQRLATLIA